MRLKREPKEPRQELRQTDLEQLIDSKHPLVRFDLAND
jgi:hypothetical protein